MMPAIWPTFVSTGILLALCATPLFRPAGAPPVHERRRVRTLDGLRGFLALAIVFHHAVIYRGFLRTGIWVAPSDRFYRDLGPSPSPCSS